MQKKSYIIVVMDAFAECSKLIQCGEKKLEIDAKE